MKRQDGGLEEGGNLTGGFEDLDQLSDLAGAWKEDENGTQGSWRWTVGGTGPVTNEKVGSTVMLAAEKITDELLDQTVVDLRQI